MAGRHGAGGDDGLGFVLQVVRFFLLRPDVVVGEHVVEDGFLSDGLFASGDPFLGLDDLLAESLGFYLFVSRMFLDGAGEGRNSTCWNLRRHIIWGWRICTSHGGIACIRGIIQLNCFRI